MKVAVPPNLEGEAAQHAGHEAAVVQVVLQRRLVELARAHAAQHLGDADERAADTAKST